MTIKQAFHGEIGFTQDRSNLGKIDGAAPLSILRHLFKDCSGMALAAFRQAPRRPANIKKDLLFSKESTAYLLQYGGPEWRR